MAWTDDKKAYDMGPQSWVIHCLKMYKISHEVINFIEKIMQTWRVERGLITAIRNDTDNTIDNRMTTTRKQKWAKNNSMAALND